MAAPSQNLKYKSTIAEWQLKLIPDNETAGAKWINSIARNVKVNPKESTFNSFRYNVLSRIQVVTLPIFALFTTVQVQTKLLCNVTVHLVNLQAKDGLNQLGKDSLLVLKSIFAIFSSIIAMPAGLKDPSMYIRPKPFTSFSELTKSFQTISPGCAEAIAQLDTGEDYSFPVPIKRKLKDEEYLWSPRSQHDFGALQGLNGLDNNFEIFHTTLPGYFETISDIDAFLRPTGVFEFETKLPLATIASAKFLGLDIFTLDGKHSISDLSEFDPSGFIRDLKALTIKNNTVKVSDIALLNQKFPNIACFDLRGSTVEVDDTNTLARLRENLIIITDAENNVQTQFNKLQACIFRGLRNSNDDPGTILSLAEERPTLENMQSENVADRQFYYENFSPAACFIPKIGFLKYLEISETLFDTLIGRFKLYFRSLKRLDLSDSPQLTYRGVSTVGGAFDLSHLSLAGCGMIYKRKKSGTRGEYENVAPDLKNILIGMFASGLQVLDVSRIRDDQDDSKKGRFFTHLQRLDGGLFARLKDILPKLGRSVKIKYGQVETLNISLPQ